MVVAQQELIKQRVPEEVSRGDPEEDQEMSEWR